MMHVDHRLEAREFLQSRRARLNPRDCGLKVVGTRRRVPGLRREEVAQLAGVSVDYYTRLEKGRLETASQAVLQALARALQLDHAERSHLFALARLARGEVVDRRCPTSRNVRPSLEWMLDAMTMCPAYVRNDRLDVLAANDLVRALYVPLFEDGDEVPNVARCCFLNPSTREFFSDWTSVAERTVALLRTEPGRHPEDRLTQELVDELHDDPVFRELWASHDVRLIPAATMVIDHPRVGHLELAIETLSVASDPGLTLVTYSARPGSSSAEGLRRLARSMQATRVGV
jgi:transcriptional regulator with XRE-family HTH domain